MKKPMTLTKRPSTPITIRMPVDVLEDLKRIAPLKGMSGYQALIKFYISQGLREDLRSLWEEEQGKKLESALNEFGLKPEQKQLIRNLILTANVPDDHVHQMLLQGSNAPHYNEWQNIFCSAILQRLMKKEKEIDAMEEKIAELLQEQRKETEESVAISGE